MTDNLKELKHHQKEQRNNTHQVTPTPQISLPKKDARITYFKPSEEFSSGSYNNLMLIMRCSIQRQSMEQEERAEQAKEQEERAKERKQNERADMLFCQEQQRLQTNIMMMIMMLMGGGAACFAAGGNFDPNIADDQGGDQNSRGDTVNLTTPPMLWNQTTKLSLTLAILVLNQYRQKHQQISYQVILIKIRTLPRRSR